MKIICLNEMGCLCVSVVGWEDGWAVCVVGGGVVC